MSAKFGRGDDLALFQDNVMEHLKDTGMDTISYMPDPEDPDKMISVVLGHSRFTLSSVRGHSRLQVPFYDNYDRGLDTHQEVQFVPWCTFMITIMVMLTEK